MHVLCNSSNETHLTLTLYNDITLTNQLMQQQLPECYCKRLFSQIRQDGDCYEPNSIIFCLLDGYYVAPKDPKVCSS